MEAQAIRDEKPFAAAEEKFHELVERLSSTEAISGTCSAQGRNRTSDTGIFSPLLYQLSYLGVTKGGRTSAVPPHLRQARSGPDPRFRLPLRTCCNLAEPKALIHQGAWVDPDTLPPLERYSPSTR